tara:strand:+ start:116 stop:355 length:240 start_codon:yes stop_codon:yes gene_type:complete
MNVKSIFGTVGDFLGGIGAVLVGLISVGVLSQIVFGTGWLGIDVIGNLTGIVNGFLGAGLTGLIVLVVLCGLWDSKSGK